MLDDVGYPVFTNVLPSLQCHAALGGVQNWAWALMKSQLALGHQIEVCCDRMDPINQHRVMQVLNDEIMAVTQNLIPSPTTCPTRHAVWCTHMRYFNHSPLASRNMVPKPYKLPILPAAPYFLTLSD